MFENKSMKSIVERFLDNAFQKLGPFDALLRKKNENGSNFMHLVECRFAPPFWSKYLTGENGEILRQIVREMLKQKDDKGLTPIQKHLDNPQMNYKAICKLFNERIIDLENRDTFEGCEDDVIKGFVNYFAKQFDNKETKTTDMIDKNLFY